jgi:hypothetical protein
MRAARDGRRGGGRPGNDIVAEACPKRGKRWPVTLDGQPYLPPRKRIPSGSILSGFNDPSWIGGKGSLLNDPSWIGGKAPFWMERLLDFGFEWL